MHINTAIAKHKAGLAYPIHEALARRWSPRSFSSQLLSDAQIGRLFEAARWAPSSMNEQPWRFLYATRDDEAAFQAILDTFYEGNRTWAQHAPLLVVALAKTHFTLNGRPNRHAWHDVGQAIAYLTVQATAMDLYVRQIGGFSADKVREQFGIGEGFEPVTAFAVGHLGDLEALPEEKQAAERAPQRRKALEEVVIKAGAGRVV